MKIVNIEEMTECSPSKGRTKGVKCTLGEEIKGVTPRIQAIHPQARRPVVPSLEMDLLSPIRLLVELCSVIPQKVDRIKRHEYINRILPIRNMTKLSMNNIRKPVDTLNSKFCKFT